MNRIERAAYLVELFLEIGDPKTYTQRIEDSKGRALICVREILKALLVAGHRDDEYEEYWSGVADEIRKYEL